MVPHIHDAVGRRAQLVDSSSLTNDFGYNVRSELIEAIMGTNHFSYDYMSRRVAKAVNGQVTAFAYQGWAMFKETTSSSTNSYVYGLDLSGTPQGAGTIGGILCASLNGSKAFYAYDGNGNVIDLVGTNGSFVAKYQYDPYGNTIGKSGDLADVNHFRFSTKYTDSESGLVYYGYRFYVSESGRWASRDPAWERGGRNLYGFVDNGPINAFDKLGLDKLTLTYDMQSKDNTSWLERLMMPGNTEWATSMDEALKSLKAKVGKYDPEGKDCNCILKLTITGHSGVPGIISLGDGMVSPDGIGKLEEIRKKYQQNGRYKKLLDALSREEQFLSAIKGLMCRKGASIDFAQCQTEHPDTRKFLEHIFGDDVDVILYDLNVRWEWGKPKEVPIKDCKDDKCK